MVPPTWVAWSSLAEPSSIETRPVSSWCVVRGVPPSQIPIVTPSPVRSSPSLPPGRNGVSPINCAAAALVVVYKNGRLPYTRCTASIPEGCIPTWPWIHEMAAARSSARSRWACSTTTSTRVASCCARTQSAGATVRITAQAIRNKRRWDRSKKGCFTG